MGEGINVSRDVSWCGPPGRTHKGIDTFDLVFGNNFVLRPHTFLRMHMQRTNCTVNFSYFLPDVLQWPSVLLIRMFKNWAVACRCFGRKHQNVLKMLLGYACCGWETTWNPPMRTRTEYRFQFLWTWLSQRFACHGRPSAWHTGRYQRSRQA